MIEKKDNDSLQHLHFDLGFGGEGGMPGLSHALVPAQESKRWSFGPAFTSACHSEGSIFGPEKVKQN